MEEDAPRLGRNEEAGCAERLSVMGGIAPIPRLTPKHGGRIYECEEPY